jgi:hypothetical protein
MGSPSQTSVSLSFERGGAMKTDDELLKDHVVIELAKRFARELEDEGMTLDDAEKIFAAAIRALRERARVRAVK